MRKYIALFAAAGLALALAACSPAAAPSSGGTGASPAPAAPVAASAPDAKTVWTTLSTKSYQSWSTAPGYATKQPAKGPHGKSVQIFVDPNIAKTLSGPAVTEWPVGSTIVKDAFDAAGAPVAVEYMQKTDAGWYFASFGTDGTVAKEGVKVDPCQKCHATGSDSVKSFKLPGGSSSGY